MPGRMERGEPGRALHFEFHFPVMKHQQIPALSCLERDGSLPTDRSLAGTSTAVRTLLEAHRSTPGTYTGSGERPGPHRSIIPGAPVPALRGLSGCGARPGRGTAESSRFPRVCPGRSPGDGEPGKGFISAAPGAAGKAAPALGACFKSQMSPGAGARPPRREQCAAPRPPPPAPPGFGEGRGKARAVLLLPGSRGAVPRRDRERLEKQRRPGLK